MVGCRDSTLTMTSRRPNQSISATITIAMATTLQMTVSNAMIHIRSTIFPKCLFAVMCA